MSPAAFVSAVLLVGVTACSSAHPHHHAGPSATPAVPGVTDSASPSVSTATPSARASATTPGAASSQSATSQHRAATTMHFDPANTMDAMISADGSRIIFGALQTVDGHRRWHVIARDVRTNGFSRVDIPPPAWTLPFADGAQPAGLSADGRHVLFETVTTDGFIDGIYERDLTTHRTVDVPWPDGSNAEASALSRDGRFVVVVAKQRKVGQVWLSDMVAGTTTLVSQARGGTGGNGNSYSADVSPDGSQVVFESYASDLVPDDTNDKRDIFRWDRRSRAITRISVSSTGQQLAEGSSAPRFTTDGAHVVFASDARLTSDACDGGSEGDYQSDDARNDYVLDLKTGKVTHPKQDCTHIEHDNVVVGSDGGTTLAVGVEADYDYVVVRRNGTQRASGVEFYTQPTSITANGRFVGIDHYDAQDNPPHDPFAGALIWDLAHNQPAPAWLVQTTA